MNTQKTISISMYYEWDKLPEDTVKQIEFKLMVLIMPPQHFGQYGWEYNLAIKCHKAQESRLKTKLQTLLENGMTVP